MGLVPGKDNPKRPCLASPRVEPDGRITRRCTHCLARKLDTEFRWLLTGIRRSSWCKICESQRRIRVRLLATVPMTRMSCE